MATSALSLPVDVPWKRVAISPDMYASSIDVDLPEKWRSSMAVFAYDPPVDPTDTTGEVTTFLKLITTITGYNYDAVVALPGNKTAAGTVIDLGTVYYPAYCAVAQLAVFPDTGQWDLPQFPYFTDFQPKVREVVETQTATGEIATHSTDPLNVTKSTTSTGSQQTQTAYTNNNYNSAGGQTTTGTVNETLFTDASRERRETTSYTTNLSQLYQLLDSYHSGTNRALFLTTPRPHLVDSVYTFVNGPRRLEGIQEYFLVVRRPQNMTGICVKAVLETAHLDPTDQSGDPATLFTTARAVTGCIGQGGAHNVPAGTWVTSEQTLSSSVNDLLNAAGQSASVAAVAAANGVSRAIQDMVISTYRTGMRYSLGQVDFLRTNFATRKLIGHLSAEQFHADSTVLEAARKVQGTLAQRAPLLSSHDLKLRSQLLTALGVQSTGA